MADLNEWEEWLESQALQRPFCLTPIEGGMNNRGYLLESSGCRHFLKHYRNLARLHNEYRLLELLRHNPWTPQPAAKEEQLLLGLYEYIEGKPVQPDLAAARQALTFLQSLQTIREADLPPASDACLDTADHLQALLKRVQALEGAHPAAATWKERWLPLRDSILQKSLPPSAAPAELMVSPSDFGFHNALQLAGGRVRFLDLEYGGLDDPAKILCDFFAQPKIPAPLEALPEFLAWLPEHCRVRMSWMWPVCVLKWACIITRPLLESDRFAHGTIETPRQLLGLDWLRQRQAEVGQLLGL